MRALKIVLPLLAIVIIGIWSWRTDDSPEHRIPVVGTVSLTAVDNRTIEGLKEGMAALGRIEGDTVRYRVTEPAGAIAKLDGIVAGQLSAEVDLIFVSSTPATLAVKRATQNDPVPVVFTPVSDPIGSGIVDSIQSPGGNITGIRLPMVEEPRLEWLKRLAPDIKTVFLPYNPEDGSSVLSYDLVDSGTRKLGLDLMTAEVRNPDDLHKVLAALPDEADAIFVPRDSMIESQIASIVKVARERKIPTSVPSLLQVESGALYCFGHDHHQMGIQAARLVSRILDGVAPGELPIETGDGHLAINLSTAESIGLQIPERHLRQATRLIR